MTGRVLVPGVPHKPQGDSKSAVLSLNGGLSRSPTQNRSTMKNTTLRRTQKSTQFDKLRDYLENIGNENKNKNFEYLPENDECTPFAVVI